MKELTFVLHITPDQYHAYYQGAAKTITVTTEDGLSLKFPASAMQKFFVHDGIHGRFKISFDQNNKLQGVTRL
jgi:cell wall assembly regulator SMI1